ncbi:MAG: hypothetical protein OM95_05135 [Bdellovibrio sp. ArHS]|uniref:nucleotidyltransferase domain-containing protein n=1 Tax=Bdellovibrio sp. ArHS TaxID=1569284 RepID=UPI000582F73F|nr:nucleotidyltransferase domain-containing protein [Bdellovibrio sp. ArHS]KHD89199.1 MAG: hypothetical protein OM95_05135 [Bdellovibrio sp. ArHS]
MAEAFDKNKIIEALSENLKSSSRAQAAWLGGSTATGYEDSLSDTDIVVISSSPEEIFKIIEASLRQLFPIEHIWNVEDSPWKNFSQKFYVLEQAPSTYYVDAGVFQSLEPADYAEYFNVERHGAPVLLFDKSGILQAAAQSPRYENSKKMDWSQWIARFEILYRTFLKESMRGKYIDSYTFYQRLVMMWVQLLRGQRAPQKHDFGMRYLYRDLPADEAAYIEKLLQVSNIRSMQEAAADLKMKMTKFPKDVSL